MSVVPSGRGEGLKNSGQQGGTAIAFPKPNCARPRWSPCILMKEGRKEVEKSVLHVNVRTPDFVHILSSVQVLSTFCPMIVQFLTTFCLCPAFDYFMSQNCQLLSRSHPVIVLLSMTDPIFVLLLSTPLTPIQAKSIRQKLVKS